MTEIFSVIRIKSLDLTDDKSALVQVMAFSQQHITWSNIDQDLSHSMLSLWHNELKTPRDPILTQNPQQIKVTSILDIFIWISAILRNIFLTLWQIWNTFLAFNIFDTLGIKFV